jgi:hypothetical protein
MPRDEPVGSFGRFALKLTEFSEKVGLIGFAVLHDVPPPFSMIPVATNSLAKQAPNRGAGENRDGTLLGVSGSALAPNGPAKAVPKGVSSILRTVQCRRGNFGVRRSQQFPHLFDGQVGCGIRNAGSVEEELAVQSFHCYAANESRSPGWIWIVYGLWSIWATGEAPRCVWPASEENMSSVPPS